MAQLRQSVSRWLLIDGDRHVVAALLVAGVFLVLLGLDVAGAIDLTDRDAVRAVVGGFVPGLIAFLSIVLAINQLVLSQEFGSAGEIWRRIEDVREYRHEVESMAGTGPSPVLPTGFLSFVVRTIEAKAGTLEESVGPETDPETRERVQTYARHVVDEARYARDSLEQVQPGRINALLPVLEYDDSRQLIDARRLQSDETDLSTETEAALSGLVEALELFSVARTQFRTTYTQRVLARLSRHLLYVGLPALLVVVIAGLMDPIATLPDDARVVVVSATFAVAFAPLAVLAAFLVRVAAVSERTIAVGPFVSRPRATADDGGSTAERAATDDNAPPVTVRDRRDEED